MPALSGLGLFQEDQVSYTTAPRNSDCEFRQTDEPAPWSLELESGTGFNAITVLHAGVLRTDEPSSPKILFRPILDPGPATLSMNELYGYCVHDFCWKLLQSDVGHITTEMLLPLINILKDRYSRCEIPFMSDPAFVPEIAPLIEKSARKDRLRVDSFGKGKSATKLPLELQLLVLDYMGYETVNQTLTAFCWSVPDSYFEGRFRSHLFPELASYSRRAIDWYELWYQSEALLADPWTAWGLKSRRLLFNCMRVVRQDFVAFKADLAKQQNPLAKDEIEDLSRSHRRRWPGATYASNSNVNETWKEMLFALEEKKRIST